MARGHLRTASILFLLLTLWPAFVLEAEPQWPDTELGRHVQAWFDQLRGDEAAARAFFASHFSPGALNEVPLEARLARRRTMLERSKGLTPLEVIGSTPSSMQVRARDGSGQEPVVIFDAEPDPPHRIRSVRLELDGRGGAPPIPTGPPLTATEAAGEIRALLDRAAKTDSFSGAVLWAKGGKTLLRQAWGVADRSRGTLLTPETRFNLASIGKIPTRIALAQLAQAGKLSLDDRLSDDLPDFPRASDITLDMLAEHRSGVGDIFNERYEAMDHSRLRHNRDYLALIRDQPLWFEPGTQERYSNGGYVLLGEVIAKASGMDYYDYLATHIFAPAGMKSTAALIEGDGTPNVARGYTHHGAPAEEEVDNVASRPWRGSAAGGSYSTLDDLLALDRALLGARFCNPGWSAWVIGGPRPDRGATTDGGFLDAPAFVFAGGAPGISTEWLHEGDRTLIVLTNRDPEVSRPFVQSVEAIVRRVPDGPTGR
jgi:CubicO group peptidase (beta-lactamase class C family)